MLEQTKVNQLIFLKRLIKTLALMLLNPIKSCLLSYKTNTKQIQNKYKTNTNIKLHNFGVSNLKGELIFHENILDETSTFEELNLDSKYLEKKAKVLGVSKENIIVDSYKVDVIKLADFLKENPYKNYAVLKIDVEGHELQCLEGLFVNEKDVLPIRFIQLESHNDDMYLNNNQHKDIENILDKNGFEKIAEIKHGFGDFAELIFENKKINEIKHCNSCL
jgi:FkbM family methyltransferase